MFHSKRLISNCCLLGVPGANCSPKSLTSRSVAVVAVVEVAVVAVVEVEEVVAFIVLVCEFST